MKLLALSADDLRAALPMPAAIGAMKDAYAAIATKESVAPQRIAVPVAPHEGTTLLMGGYVPSMGLAAKIVSVFPRNAERGTAPIQGLVVVLDPETGAPAALIDGTALTAWRTGAGSGAATDVLARKDARVGAVIGCGAQGRTQLLAMCAVRELDEVRVHARSPERVFAFCDTMRESVHATLVPAKTATEAIEGADVVCTATPARAPLFDGACLADGAHVNAVGSFTLEMMELDAHTISRATVFVDEVDAALEEAGELAATEREGATHRDDWTELGLVTAGLVPGRTSQEELTLFKSVGHAAQDVAAATRAVAEARRLGLGFELELV
ncbi:MAG: ornithine cyclodeaminase [Acidobacteriota bacterium]